MGGGHHEEKGGGSAAEEQPLAFGGAEEARRGKAYFQGRYSKALYSTITTWSE